MRRTRVLSFGLPVVLAVAAGSGPASAQGFFDKLFGGPAQLAPLPPPAPSYRAPVRVPQSRTDWRADERAQTSREKLRTVCVRLCDGYYFPISNRTTASRLSYDQRRCKSACDGGDARLFQAPEGSDDPASMVDATGRRYDALDTAFLYRRKLLPGCTCKPAPWSAAERLRHVTYAIEQAKIAAREREAAEKLRLAENDARGGPAAVQEPKPSVGASEVAVIPPPAGADPATETLVVPAAEASTGETARTAASGAVRDSGAGRRRAAASAAGEVRTSASHGPAARRATASVSAKASGGLFGLGPSKYVWPGDQR